MGESHSNQDRLIAVSKRIFDELEQVAVAELDGDDPVPELLNSVVMCWLSDAVNCGHLDPDDELIDELQRAMARLAVKLVVKRRAA